MLPLRKYYCNLFSWGHIRLFCYPANKHSVLITWFYVWFLGVKTLFIEPGSPWENGYIESVNGKLRDELLNREIFTTLTEAKILIEQ